MAANSRACMNLPVRCILCASNQPDEGLGAIPAGAKQWGMPDEIQENVTRAKQLARNRFQRRYILSPRPVKRSLKLLSPPSQFLALPPPYATSVTCPFLAEFSRLFPTRYSWRRREAISIDTDERGEKERRKNGQTSTDG